MEVSFVLFLLLLSQDISGAGGGLGLEGERSYLVVHMVRLVDETGACLQVHSSVLKDH